MHSAARASLYFAGIVLLLAAALIIGQRLEAKEPLEPLIPCVLAVFGLGLFGIGLFASAPLADSCRAMDDGRAGDEDFSDGGSD